MLRRTVTVIGWGALGVALAAALILGAFVVAGTSLTEPATVVRVTGPPLRPGGVSAHEPTPSEGAPTEAGPSATTRSPGVTADDRLSPTPLSPSPLDDGDAGVERGDD